MINRLYKKNKDKIQILEINVPCDSCNISNCPINNKFFLRPIYGQSWNSFDSIIINFVNCNIRRIIYLSVIIILTCIIIYQINR